MCLIPAVREAISIPLIAAGGIGSGRAMLAAMVLGAEGVQIGSRFVATPEASSHQAFKEAVVAAGEGDTMLSLKSLTPVRLLRNHFFQQVQEAEAGGATKADLEDLLGRARAKRGMSEGDMQEGELEIGQVSAMIHSIKPAVEVLAEIWNDFKAAAEHPFFG
jgi:enoyl-[acyl-carrier protein] reductase II